MRRPRLDLLQHGNLFVGQPVEQVVAPAGRAKDMDRQRPRRATGTAKNLAGVGGADAGFACEL